MSPFLQLGCILVMILFAAKIGGYLSTRLGQPSVLGELLAGVLLGPSLINIIHLPFVTDAHLLEETVLHLGELGVLLLMFLAGLELHLADLAKNTKVSAYSGILGVVIPVGLGWLLGSLYDLPMKNAVFLGLTLGATSVSISAQTLIELGVLRSRVGLGLLGSAVFDDILVILLLSTFIGLTSGGDGLIAVLIVVVRMVGFLLLSVAFGLWLLPKLSIIAHKLPISMGMLTFAIIIMLVYGLAAELLGGMAAITGAFIAGLMFSRTPQRNDIEGGAHALSYAFFVPIFFVTIGLSVNVRGLESGAIWFLLIISIVGILGKVVGSGIGAKFGGFSWLESLQLGIGMISRGEVGLIVAAVGLTEGLLTDDLFSAIVGMVLISTLVTPPLLRSSFRIGRKNPPARSPHPEKESA